MAAPDVLRTHVLSSSGVQFGPGGHRGPLYLWGSPPHSSRRRGQSHASCSLTLFTENLLGRLPPAPQQAQLSRNHTAKTLKMWLSTEPSRRARGGAEGAVSGVSDSVVLWLLWKDECQEMCGDNWLDRMGKPGPYITPCTKVNFIITY